MPQDKREFISGRATSKETWILQQEFLAKVRAEGATVLTSMANSYAEDKGMGLITSGVNECVSLASEDSLCHIRADLVLSKDVIDEFISKFQGKKVTMFGVTGSALFEKVREKIERVATPVSKVSISPEEKASFAIIVKDKKIRWFLEIPLDGIERS